MRISDLRSAIEKQQAAAEKQQDELEAAGMASLSVSEQLLSSFCSRIHSVSTLQILYWARFGILNTNNPIIVICQTRRAP